MVRLTDAAEFAESSNSRWILFGENRRRAFEIGPKWNPREETLMNS